MPTAKPRRASHTHSSAKDLTMSSNPSCPGIRLDLTFTPNEILGESSLDPSTSSLQSWNLIKTQLFRLPSNVRLCRFTTTRCLICWLRANPTTQAFQYEKIVTLSVVLLSTDSCQKKSVPPSRPSSCCIRAGADVRFAKLRAMNEVVGLMQSFGSRWKHAV